MLIPGCHYPNWRCRGDPPTPENPGLSLQKISPGASKSSRRDVVDQAHFLPGYGYDSTHSRLLTDSRTFVHGPRGHLRSIHQSASTIKVAGFLIERRATARIPQILRQCFGSPSAGRAAFDTSSHTFLLATTPSTRRNIADSAHALPQSLDQHQDEPRLFLPNLRPNPSSDTIGAAAGDAAPSSSQHTPESDRRWAQEKTRSFVDSSIPPVMSGGPSHPSRRPGTVHILGNDRRAGFLACELQQVYDSVHVFKTVDDKVVDFKFDPSKPSKDLTTPESRDRQQDHQLFRTTSEAPIRNLIATARGVDVVSALDQLKGRISDKTTLCLMNDGLGVAEELDETVFNEVKGTKPEYLLGNLDRLHLKRTALPSQQYKSLDRPFSGNTRGFIHVGSHARAYFSPYDPVLSAGVDESPLADTLIDDLRLSPHLRVTKVQAYHNWLSTKLQEMVFTSVVEPVATVVGCRYSEITSIQSALHLMMMLLEEIRRVIAVMPEVEESSNIRRLASEQFLRKDLLARLRLMRPIVPKMTTHIKRGWRVDLHSHNGYFIRRGKKLGIPCPYNEMVVAMIKAKEGMRMREVSTLVPFEITSRPHRDSY